MKDKISVPLIIVSIGVVLYILVFSFLSIRRIHILWASYFDLGIMHQTVYNTYKAIQTLDPTRILELTDPHESGKQVNRIAIHNDVLIALAAPFYFIHSGPETLLIIQTVVLGSGALAAFFIVKEKSNKWSPNRINFSKAISVLIPLAYLLYFPLQRTNMYEFHAVTLSTALILWMYLAYIKRKWFACSTLFILILLSKEHVGFSLGTFVLVEILWTRARNIWSSSDKRRLISQYFMKTSTQILVCVVIGSIIYVVLSVFVIMPSYRLGNDHFALNYYSKATTNALSFFIQHFQQLMSYETVKYMFTITSPLIFLPLFSIFFFPAIPDILINLLSASPQMKSMYFQYTAIITPWLFIAAIDTLGKVGPKLSNAVQKVLLLLFVMTVLISSSLESPLPFSRKNENRLWYEKVAAYRDILLWQQILKDEKIIVSATGQFAPYLTSRRIYYDFGVNYDKAEYVLVRPSEIKNYWIKGKLIPYYDHLAKDIRYKQIYNNNDIEVYKRVHEVN